MTLLSKSKGFCLSLYVKSNTARHVAVSALRNRVIHNPGVTMLMIGLMMTLAPLGLAQAQTFQDVSSNWTSTIISMVEFIMNVAVLIGVAAIGWGIKLMIDKSNERENVKNGHIVWSFVGGGAMCMLWFFVKVLSNTVGEENSMGEFNAW